MLAINYDGAVGKHLTATRLAARHTDGLIPTAMALFNVMAAAGLVTFKAMASGTMTWAIAYQSDGETLTTPNLAGGLDDDGNEIDPSAVYLIPCRPGTASSVAAGWKVAAAAYRVKATEGVDLTTTDGATAHVRRVTGQPVTSRTVKAIASPATKLVAAGTVKVGAAGTNRDGQVKAVEGTLRHASAAAVTGKTASPSARKTPTGEVWCSRMATMAADVGKVADWSPGHVTVALADVEVARQALLTVQSGFTADDLATLDTPMEAPTS